MVGQFYLKAPRPKLYGLVIGVDDYGGRFNLAGAVNDAKRLSSALDAAGAEKVVTLIDHDARLKFIDYVWTDLLDDADPGDTIAFTFAGQGTREPAPDKKNEADGLRDFLILPGPQPLDKFSSIAEFDTDRKLTDDIFTEWMAAAARKNVNVIVLIDGCHAGGILDRELANVSFFGASHEDEIALEKSLGGEMRGLASYVFSEGISGGADLNGDGYVTQRELFAFGDENIFHMSASKQNPQFYPTLPTSNPGLVLLQLHRPAVQADLKRYWQDLPRGVEGQEAR